MKTVKIVAFALVVGLAMSAAAAPKYYAKLTASGYSGASTLTNFPVLVRISGAKISGFSYSQCAANGADISFVAADGTTLVHEIDTWNPEGESLVWVKLPELATNTTFKIGWGSGESSSVTASDTWPGYLFVWHLDDATGAKKCANSSPYGTTYDATVIDSDPTHGALQKLYFGEGDAAAPIGGARCFTESTASWYSFLKMTNDYNSAIGTPSKFTVSTWIYAATNSSGAVWGDNNYKCLQLFRNKASSLWDTGGFWAETVSPTGLKVYGNTSQGGPITIPSLTARWAHVAIVYDDTKATVYVDGIACGSVTIAAVAQHATNFQLCSSVWFPRADECRLMKGAASADWVKADYDTVKKADFLTCKSQGFMLLVR